MKQPDKNNHWCAKHRTSKHSEMDKDRDIP